MGLKVRYFMPPHSVAPLAFYFTGDLLSDYTNLELISTISTMETFQKIYRPEIYNANSVAGKSYQPSLKHQDYSLTRIVYDREERSRLAIEQGKFVEEQFIKPYQAILEQWSANYALINQHIGHLLWKVITDFNCWQLTETVLACRTWKALVAVETRKRRLSWR